MPTLSPGERAVCGPRRDSPSLLCGCRSHGIRPTAGSRRASRGSSLAATVEVSALREYKRKRRFDRTPEPAPRPRSRAPESRFVVQKHRASQLHYDFRLEAEGVLKSWAVPKGPSLDPKLKRLAMMVEDHPIEYADFEGAIPEGEYGGGTVMVWDRGTYAPEDDVATALRKGALKFTLRGRKLRGSWVLVRTRGRQWLLMKHRDRYASTKDVTEDAPRSVVTRRLLAEIAEQEGGDVKKAATGDPKRRRTR
jgi:bifunctional non-homologous end joining protein LigD